MRYEAREVQTKDGRTLILRSPEITDAAAMIACLKQVTGETEYLLRLPEEVTYTVEQEQELICRWLESDRSMMIAVCDPDGKQVFGTAAVNPIGDKARNRHRGSIGISLYRELWGQGLGTMLMEEIVEASRRMGYAQVELGVYADNERAIHLYEKQGFETVGRMPRAFRLRDGSFRDELMMVRFLKEYRDVYTREGVSQHRVVEKHEPSIPGDYYKHVLVIMKTDDSPSPGDGMGRYIMQQRSLYAKFYAGLWDATGGAVQAGETDEQAAVREVKEELGITLDTSDLRFAWNFTVDWENGTGLLFTVFACRVKIPENGFDYNHREVNDIRVFSYDVFAEKMLEHNDEAFARELQKIEDTL